jgi:chromosome segregation ATPase
MATDERVDSVPKGKLEEEDYESKDFVELENDFQSVLKEVGGDKQLEHFRLEYEKLHRALKSSHENEKKLIKKCKELNQEITESTMKVQQALRLSQEENENIRAFKADLDRALKTIETFKEKEDKAKQTILNLRQQIEQLGKIVEQGSGLAVGQDSTVNELLRAKEDLAKDVGLGNEQILSNRQANSELLEKIQKLEQAKTLQEKEILEFKEQIAQAKQRLEMEDKCKKDIEIKLDEEKKAFEESKKKIEDKDSVQQGLAVQKQELIKEIKKLEEKKKEQEINLDMQNKKKQSKLEKKRQKQELGNNIVREVTGINMDLKKAQEEFESLEEEQERLRKDLSSHTKKNSSLTQERREAEMLRDQARDYVQMLIRESDALRKNTEMDQKSIENMKRERDMVMKSVLRAKDSVKVQDEQIVTQKNNQKKIKNEISGYTKENSRMTQMVYQLQKEKERYGIEKSQAYAKYRQCLEEVKLCNSVIAELQKKNVDVEAKIKQQLSLYEAVRSDRNLYSKNLIESHDEIEELEKKKKIMKHNIDQLKEEITMKDRELITENKKLGTFEKSKQELECAKKKLEKKQRKLEEVIRESEREIQKLKYVITEVEQEKLKQKKELELVTNERDILGTQLIRREEELNLLYEKIKIYTSTLSKGEKQYKERIADISLLKLKIGELKQNLNGSKKEAAVVFDLKKEKYHLERETLEEKIKVKALSEEVENTMNVHRWRKLEGTDPETFELITKIHTLQKRLIQKSEEIIIKAAEMQAIETEYNKLKVSLSRHPGPESAEQIELCRQTLEEKRQQMMDMEQELAIIRSQENEYRYEIDRLNRELQDVKKKFFDLKKQDTVKKEKLAKEAGQEKSVIMRHPPPQKFMGGGFNLAI